MTQPLPSQPAIAVATVIPTLSNRQVSEVFRLMVAEYGLAQSIMLEMAGHSLVNLARRLSGGNLAGQPITILAGAGKSGATGLVAARYLTNAGAHLAIILSRAPDALGPATNHQYRMLQRMGQVCFHQLPTIRLMTTLRESALLIDTLLAGGLHNWPTGPEAFLIQAIRRANRPVVALDLPSGLSPDGEGVAHPELVVQAAATLALALPRLAHVQPFNYANLGDLYLADLGIPSDLYTRLGLQIGSLFSASDLVLLRSKSN